MTGKKPFTPESLLELRGVSDPQLAPDGVRVVYLEHWIETIAKDGHDVPSYRSTIMLSDGPDAPPRRLTWSPTGVASAPRFSPDGRYLAFTSTRHGDKPHLYVLDFNGGDARPLTTPTELSEGIQAFDWHPDSSALCFLTTGHKTADDNATARTHDERVFDGRLPFKFDGAGILHPDRSQLWRVGRDGTGLAQLTHTPYDIEEPRWSPTGDAIAFTSIARPEHEWSYIRDLFVLDLNTHELRQLTASQGPVEAPTWDATGQRLAFLGHNQRSGPATNVGVWTIDLAGGLATCLTDGIDRSVGSTTMGDVHFGSHPDRIAWSGERLFFTATDHGRTGIYHVPTSGGKVTQSSTSGLSALNFTLQAGTIAFHGETNTRIGEIYTMTEDGKAVARRSHAADEIASSYAVSIPEHIAFKGVDDWDLEGWLIKPAGFTEDRRYPLVLYIHGGPHMDFGNGFFHEFQVLANAGFGVFFCNPRGGRSYGEAFTNAVRSHFGEKDYEDLMKAADLAASWSWVDPERMGIMGGSYGGYMTNWIITHTDRFAAACTQRSISNLVSFAGTSDIGPRFSRDEFGGLPWTDEEFLMSHSPIRYVKNVRTPTLILHQENDHRCPMEQAEQFYTALVYLGVPVRFVRFPEEGHNLSRSGQPQRRINRINHMINWFDHYLKPTAE
ncbi:MAG: S9 family peptidase [Herpetosiphonaceae bacterium]|nr:S9 family peptidase [Herpetosiphonaceae bacterium]